MLPASRSGDDQRAVVYGADHAGRAAQALFLADGGWAAGVDGGAEVFLVALAPVVAVPCWPG